MGLLDMFSKNNNQQLKPLIFAAPTPDEDKRIRKELTGILRKKITMQYMICLIAGVLAIALPIGLFKNGGIDFKGILVTLVSIVACGAGIWYIITRALPKHRTAYKNFKEGKYGVFNAEPSSMYLKTIREGKENEYGNVQYINEDGSKGTLKVLFLANDVRVYNKNKKELLGVQVISIEECDEIYGLMNFGRRSYFY